MSIKTAPLAPEEVARRLEILADTRHSIEMEGGTVPADTEAVFQRWARGEVTLEEMGAEVRRLYPSTAHQ